MIAETLFQYLIEKTLETAGRFLKERKLKFSTTAKELEEAVSLHLSQISRWSEEVTFKDIGKAKPINQIFIDIDILLMPRRNRIMAFEEQGKVSSRNLFNEIKNHIVILGQPGAGKTTLMKFICKSILHNEDYYPDQFKIPLLIRLREFNIRFKEKNERNPIINILFETLGLTLESKSSDLKEEEITLAKERILAPILEELKPVIILDGYDEISSGAAKEKIFNDFHRLVLSLTYPRVILTSRSSDFYFGLEKIDVLEIAALNIDQIKSFVAKWLIEKEKVERFLHGLETSPFKDTAIRPLTLAHLCAIFERSGRIPDKPKTIYKKIVNLLLEEWDEQRGVRRISKYANFEVDRKQEFLCRLAFEITLKFQRTVFTDDDLKIIYHNIYIDYDLRKEEADEVINEIETHTGLILQVGYEEYEFAHKSIHEYLCAEHLVKLPSMPSAYMIPYLPNELAIAVTISSNPSLYFCELVNILNSTNVDNSFILTFANRLILEKPDFNTSKDIGFALIILYNLFRTESHGQLKIFEFDDLAYQFEKFVELIFLRNKRLDLSKHYSVIEKRFTERNNIILQLKKKTTEMYYGMFYMPEYLFTKKEFVSGLD